VEIGVLHERPKPKSAEGLVRIIVEDDGPGLSSEQREQITKRGRRLDETKPGSGLGLSIVVELANLYGGELTFGVASIGGLRAELTLPAV
jgi:signal transduction histidine kinase